jgi:hypothetical protein
VREELNKEAERDICQPNVSDNYTKK